MAGLHFPDFTQLDGARLPDEVHTHSPHGAVVKSKSDPIVCLCLQKYKKKHQNPTDEGKKYFHQTRHFAFMATFAP